MAEKRTWKDVISFLDNEGIEHEVNGEMLTFYPVSMGTLFKVKSIGKPLAKALAILFDDKNRDYGTVNRSMRSEDGAGVDTEIIIDAVTVDMATLRSKQKEESIEGLIDALLDDDAKKTIGALIVESIKKSEHFKDVDMPSPLEFMNTIPADSIIDFLTGVAKANKGVLGPLAETLTDLWAKVHAKVKKAVSEEPLDTDTATSSPTKDTKESPTVREAD